MDQCSLELAVSLLHRLPPVLRLAIFYTGSMTQHDTKNESLLALGFTARLLLLAVLVIISQWGQTCVSVSTVGQAGVRTVMRTAVVSVVGAFCRGHGGIRGIRHGRTTGALCAWAVRVT